MIVGLLGSFAFTAVITVAMCYYRRWRRTRSQKIASENGALISRNNMPLSSYHIVENVNYFPREAREASNNPTIGILLCH